MKISNISIKTDCDDDYAIATASLVIDDCIFINGIRIMETDCLRIKMPCALDEDGICSGVIGFINQDSFNLLEKAVKNAYNIYLDAQKRITELVITD